MKRMKVNLSSVSEIKRSALRLSGSEETNAKTLIKELKIGEKSGMVKNFDRTENLKKLRFKHLKNGLSYN